jgi:hypothetical protein
MIYARYRNLRFVIAIFGAWCAANCATFAQSASSSAQSATLCPDSASGLKLPPGFCATIFADGIGHARHLVVAPTGIVYVNTWSGRYYGNDTPHAGGFLVALRDTTGTGKADVIRRFGETVQSGGAGGTGIGLYHGRNIRRDQRQNSALFAACGLDRTARLRGDRRDGIAA